MRLKNNWPIYQIHKIPCLQKAFHNPPTILSRSSHDPPKIFQRSFNDLSNILQKHQTVLPQSSIWNPSIYNIIRWVAWIMGQTNRRPSVWCSKYYFFHDFLQNSLQKSFQFIFLFLYKITKIKIKSFECPKSKRNYEKKCLEHQTLGRWVVRPSDPVTQRLILKIGGFLISCSLVWSGQKLSVRCMLLC